MKIYINKYKNNWISPYTVKKLFFFWKKDYDAFDKEPPAWLQKTCEGWLKIANKLNREIRYIHIDSHDVWNMDSTLARIILPMLKELKRQKNGAGYVDDEDVPYGLRSFNSKPKENEYDIDDFHFMRWEWVLDELIWTFTALHPDTDYTDNYHSGNIDHVWIPSPDREGHHQLETGPNHTWTYDREGHKLHQDRVNNGLRLFGKYYHNLWD